MLLPSSPQSLEGEASDEDPRRELVERLVEYRKYKEAALTLEQKEDEMQQHFSRLPDMSSQDSSFPEVDVTLYQLLSAFLEVLRKAPAESGLVIDREELDVRQSMVRILDCMGTNETVTLVALLGQRQSRLYLIVTFLALLELIRQGVLKVRQYKSFGEVWIYRTE
jgi:segregation and condensation protein A